MSVNKNDFAALWNAPAIRIGTMTLLLPMLLAFLPNVYLYLQYGAIPPLGAALKAWGMIAMMFGAFYIVEPISYYPVLGMTGTYMSFLSGNISNLRLPCSAVAQDAVGVETGTPEAEIISTLGIAGSILTNLFFVSLAAVVGAELLRMLPDAVVECFKSYTIPAVFGATFGQFVVKFPLIGAIAVFICVLFFFGAPLVGLGFLTQPWIVLIFAIFGTMFVTRVLYKSGLLK